MEFVDLKAQYCEYRSEIEDRMARVFAHGQFILGPEVEELEDALARYTGAAHCIAVASGTDSLEIALRALGVGPDDEVITVSFTWVSTAEAVALVGARPVFVDIEASSFNIDPDRIEDAVTPRTKTIIAVNLFGQMADYARIDRIAARHGLAVIEDAAQSFGAARHGVRSCGGGAIGSTSFFPAKPLGCYGDGGALFTSDGALAARMRAIRVHGATERHHHTLVGMNGRFDTLQAAVLLAKLPHFDRELEARTRIAARYTEELAGAVCPPEVSEGNSHVYAAYTIRSERRDALAAGLGQAGIPTAVYYPRCLHQQPVFAHLASRPGSLPQAERAAREVLSLPIHPFLTESEQDRVIEAVRRLA